MIQFELDIEHKYKEKTLGVYKLRANKPLTIIGSNKNADIQLIGEEIEGIHATIELNENKWMISDVSGESGVWIKKEPILSYDVQTQTVVHISGHSLTLKPNYIDKNLFAAAPILDKENKKQKTFHQVVVKKFGFVVESELLKVKESFKYKIGGQRYEFRPPAGNEWKVKSFNTVSVHQRLIESHQLKDSTKDKLMTIIDPSLKVPMGVAFVFMMLIAALIYFVPQDPELADVPTIEENKYTKIIYKPKTKKEKKKAAQTRKKLLAGKANKATPEPAPLTQSNPEKKKQAQAKPGTRSTISKSSKMRISKLLGKITKRASKNAIAIQTAGVAANSKKTLGPALSSGNKIANIKPNGGGGKSHSISGVSTGGKAGGKGSYRGLSGFASGSIGGSNVGIIEEETEIQGGLSKEQIARVIKSKLGQIRYCYERQLSSNPDLYGKILVNFIINASGKVEKNRIKKSTMGNSMVEGCVLRKMAGWKFPKPVGGTQVKVTYPFLLKSTN